MKEIKEAIKKLKADHNKLIKKRNDCFDNNDKKLEEVLEVLNDIEKRIETLEDALFILKESRRHIKHGISSAKSRGVNKQINKRR